MSAPTVSVLIPSYNHGPFLREALDGVLAQTLAPTEVIVLDDASTDDSLAVAERAAARAAYVRVERNESNLGAMGTIRRLTEMASGDYMISLAADDRPLPHLLERSMALLGRYPEAGYCSTMSRLIDRDGHDLGLAVGPTPATEPRYLPPAEVALLLPRDEGWYVMGNTTIYRRDALLAAGGLRPELDSFSDHFLTMVLALRHGACFVPEPLAEWRLMDTGMAATTAADPARRKSLQDVAVRLMATEFAADFPAGYADEWPRWEEVAAALRDLEARRAATLARASGRRPELARVLRAAFMAEHMAVEARETARRGLPLSRMARRRLRRRRRPVRQRP